MFHRGGIKSCEMSKRRNASKKVGNHWSRHSVVICPNVFPKIKDRNHILSVTGKEEEKY